MQLSWIYDIQEKLADAYPDGRIAPRHTENQHFYEDTIDGAVYPSVTTITSLLGKAIYKQIAANAAVDYIIAHRDDDDVFEMAREAHQVNLSQAGTWGTDAHDCVERYMIQWIKTTNRPSLIADFFTDDMAPESKSAALAAEKFFDDYTLFPIATEMQVVSKKGEYAGTLDSLWAVGEGSEPPNDCKHTWAEKSGKRVKCLKCDRVEKMHVMLGDWKSSNRVLGNTEYALQVGAYSQALYETTGIKPHYHWIIRLDKKKPQYEEYIVRDIKAAQKAFNAINDVYRFYKHGTPISLLKEKKIITL